MKDLIVYSNYHLLFIVCHKSYKQIKLALSEVKLSKAKNLLLSVNLWYTPKLLMPLLDSNLVVKMYEEKGPKVIGVVNQLSYKKTGVHVILCFRKTDLFKAICCPNLLQINPILSM